MKKKQQSRIYWIDCAKFIAIMAVLVDHTKNILYKNTGVANVSFFSVSLFILIAGITSYMSNEKHNDGYKKSIIRSCKSIVVAYLFATFVYHIFKYHSFDLEIFVNNIIRFNIAGPFYYVILYLQLMLVSYFLYKLFKKFDEFELVFFYEMLGLVIIILIAFLTTNYTNIMNIYGGGGKLLGGTYLILYYIGMLLYRHDVFKEKTLKKHIIHTIVFLIIWAIAFKYIYGNGYMIEKYLPFGKGINPPGVVLMSFSLINLFLFYNIFTLIKKFAFFDSFIKLVSYLGRHTLYIFLYHLLVLQALLQPHVTIQNNIIRMIIFYVLMITIPICIDKALEFIRKKIMKKSV